MGKELNYVVIPVEPSEVKRFKHYCDKYGMTVKRLRRSDWYEVRNFTLIDLYYLGANMAMAPFKTGVAQHI